MLIFNYKKYFSALSFYYICAVPVKNNHFGGFFSGRWVGFRKIFKKERMHSFEYPNENRQQKGYLVLIGGAEDKKNDKIILKRVVDLNKAKTAVIIPTASNYPVGIAEDYVYAFRDLGVPNCHVLDIRERSDADNTDFIEKVEQADLIFFTGGDQFRLVRILMDSRLLDKIIKQNLKGATIAGTSAGAAAACDPILFDGDSSGLQKGTINHFKGFGFIKNITIDTHFVSRGRLGRLTQFLSSGHSSKGIGIGENTAIFISPDNTFDVSGTGMVTLVNTENITYSNYDQINENDRIVINDIRIGFLQDNSSFDLKDWKVISSNRSLSIPQEKIRLYN